MMYKIVKSPEFVAKSGAPASKTRIGEFREENINLWEYATIVILYGFFNNISSYLRFHIDDSWKDSSERRSQRAEAMKRLLLGSYLEAPSISRRVLTGIVYVWGLFDEKQRGFFSITHISLQIRKSVEYLVCVPRKVIIMVSSGKQYLQK